jgi:hypothetical protein
VRNPRLVNGYRESLIAFAFAAVATLGQQGIGTSPFGYGVTGSVYGGSSDFTTVILVGGSGSSNVKFTCVPIARLLLVSPCSGTTPQNVRVSLDSNVVLNYMPGIYKNIEVRFSTVDQTPVSYASAFVTVTLNFPPGPVIGAVVSAASLQPSISPGEIVSIFGSSLGPPVLSSQPLNGVYPTFF